MTQQFVAALDRLHHRHEVGPLVELFAEDATLGKVGMPHEERGKDGARVFWKQYRAVFGDIEASFRHRTGGDDIAFLEWTSKGTLRDGSAFSYDGVSVLESHSDTINAFRTYYDTAAFLQARDVTST